MGKGSGPTGSLHAVYRGEAEAGLGVEYETKRPLAHFPQPLLLRSYISPLPPHLVTTALKMETACFSETLASAYKTARRQNQDNINITAYSVLGRIWKEVVIT
jgi:hypothetical protein